MHSQTIRTVSELKPQRQDDISSSSIYVNRKVLISFQPVRIVNIFRQLVYISEVDKFSFVAISQSTGNIHLASFNGFVFIRIAEVTESAPEHPGIEL